DISEHLN
ncbi:unnamed protein product, partial [Rotaria magnacalcarata]